MKGVPKPYGRSTSREVPRPYHRTRIAEQTVKAHKKVVRPTPRAHSLFNALPAKPGKKHTLFGAMPKGTAPKQKATPKQKVHGSLGGPIIKAVNSVINRNKKGNGNGKGNGNQNKKDNSNKKGKGDRSLQGLGSDSGQIDESLASDGAQTYDTTLADTMANQEFDPQLQVVRNQQGQQHADAAQAMHDIEQWYGQVIGSQETAKTRDAAAGTQATHDMGQVVSSILSSLGGSANAGAGMVASQGQNDASTQAMMNQAENQYQNDLTPLLKLEQAGASRGENARQSHIAMDLSNQLLALTGQKGAARTANTLKLQGLNNDILAHRLDSLLNIKQQNFSNSQTALQTKLAAQIGGAQIASLSQQSAGGARFVPWARLDPSQHDALVQQAVGKSIDPTTGGLMGDPVTAWNRARQYLVGQGFKSAAKGAKGSASQQIGALINTMLQQAIAINRQRAAQKAAQGG